MVRIKETDGEGPGRGLKGWGGASMRIKWTGMGRSQEED